MSDISQDITISILVVACCLLAVAVILLFWIHDSKGKID